MVMNELRHARHDAARRNGFTLVEVVIALAIFVFGALAIIRIFPPALGVIQNSGDRLVGNNLNRSLLARYDRSPGLVPDAIYDDNRTTAFWTNSLYGSVAGSRRNNSLPRVTGITGFDGSALKRYRNIVGEKHIVPEPTGSALDQIIYTQFPFAGTVTGYREDSLSGVKIGANGLLDFTNATLDSNNATYAPTTGDFAYVSYQWLENDRYWGVEEERVVLVTNTDQYDVTQAARNPGAVTLFPSGEVKVRLRRQLVSPTEIPASFSTDDAAVGKVTLTHPTSPPANPPLPLPAGTKISFDYEVKDWRWLVFDSVPNASSDDPGAPADLRLVNLPVRQLDNGADEYLFTAYPTQPVNTIQPVIYSNRDAVYAARSVSRTGTIPFTVPATVTTAPTSRVAYLTLDNWTQQLSVAAKNYTLYYDDTVTPQDEYWRQCVLDANNALLYFHPSEAGKTLLVSYRYTNGTGGATTDAVVENQLLTVDTNIITPVPTSVPNSFASLEGGVARLQLVTQDGSRLTQSVTAITKIQGVGIQSRVAWLDGDRFTQVVATRLRGGGTQ
jgi:prepilin-type N-terminal cleavage/methylation domain-containing protein